MKNKENKKNSIAHICAYSSLAISITMIVLWCCNVGGFKVVNLDSFVGIIVGLLAIVVTLAVGWQIYNSIEIKSKIEELTNLKEKLKTQEEENKKQTNQIRLIIYDDMAENEINRENYIHAFYYLMCSLEYSMSLEKPINIEDTLEKMEKSISRIQQDSICKIYKNIIEVNNRIATSLCYNIIQHRYEKIYNGFILKIKDSNE